MRKKANALGAVALCVILLAGCGTSTASSSESPSSSTIVQDVLSSDDNEFESLKDEAENLLEEGKYKEAVVAAAKAYQLVEDKDGEEEIPLRVAEKLAEECGLKNPKAEIDITKDDNANYIQINCESLEALRTTDEVLSICKEIKDMGAKIIEAGGIEGGMEKPYVIGDLISYGRRYSVVSNQNGEDELITMNEASVQKRAKRDNYLTEGKNSGGSSEGRTNSTKSDVIANGNGKDSYGHDKFDAFVIAENTVKEKLKSPSTAQFCTTTEATIGRNGDTWTVKGWVDAQNGYSATVRANFVVTFTFASKDTYSVALCTVS